MTAPPNKKFRAGFSDPEMVVTAVCVAVVACLMLAYFNRSMWRASQSKTVSNVRQVTLACRLYAQANNGVFPSGTEPGSSALNANTVLQDLFTSGEMELEAILWNPRATHVCAPEPPNEDGILDPGENAFDYVSGLKNTSRRDLPLVLEAQTSANTWDPNAGHPFDRQVVVGFVDASTSMLPTDKSFQIRVPHPSGEVDLLSISDESDSGSGNLPAGVVVQRAAPVAP